MENLKGENDMKTNTKKLLTIFLASALALMLSIATLFTLPTFSAKADAEQETLPAIKMAKVTETAPGKYYKAVFVGEAYNGETLYQADTMIILAKNSTTGVFEVKDMGGGGVLKATHGQSYENVMEFYVPKIEEITFDYTNTSASTIERYYTGVFNSSDFELYELSIDMRCYKASETTLNSNWQAGQVLRLTLSAGTFENVSLSTSGLDGFNIDVDNKQVYFSIVNDTQNGMKNVPTLSVWGEDYIDFVVPANIDMAFRNYDDQHGPNKIYIFTVMEYEAPVLGEDEMSPTIDVEEKDFWETIKDKVNGWGETGSAWLGDNLGITISGSALIGAAIVTAILILLFRRRK